MTLTDEQFAMLAQIERDMDSGAQPFVRFQGERWAFPGALLNSFDIESGQTVSAHMLQQIQMRNIADMQVKIAIEKARKQP